MYCFCMEIVVDRILGILDIESNLVVFQKKVNLMKKYSHSLKSNSRFGQSL